MALRAQQFSDALQVGDHTTGNTNNVRRCGAKVVVPCSSSSPHLVVLQQIRINKHTQLSAVTKGRHTTIGLSNSLCFRIGNGSLDSPHGFSLTRHMNRLHIARPARVRGESLSLCSRWGFLTSARTMKLSSLIHHCHPTEQLLLYPQESPRASAWLRQNHAGQEQPG